MSYHIDVTVVQMLQFGPGRTKITVNVPLNVSESPTMPQVSLSFPGEVPSGVRIDPPVAIISIAEDDGESCLDTVQIQDAAHYVELHV